MLHEKGECISLSFIRDNSVGILTLIVCPHELHEIFGQIRLEKIDVIELVGQISLSTCSCLTICPRLDKFLYLVKEILNFQERLFSFVKKQ